VTDAIRAALSALIDHAPLFPPASLSARDAIDEDRRAREDENAWMLRRLVWPATRIDELGDEERALSVLLDGPWLGVPSAEELGRFLRACRKRRVPFKATAGLHHPLASESRHGFLNVLAACAFEDDDALAGEVELDSNALRWRDRVAGADALARVRREQLVSVGSCSFFEPVADLRELGIL
jgi:hypothetical protein